MAKVLVLSSGGVDSTTLLYKAVKENGKENVHALWIQYGQKHEKEYHFFRYHVEKLGITFDTADLGAVFQFNPDSSALLRGSHKELVHKSYAEQIKEEGFVSAYVPYRNGLLLSYATAVALQLGYEELWYGAHADDAAGDAYPDCTPQFIENQRNAIYYGTDGKVTMRAPLWDLNKSSVVKLGLENGMTADDFRHTWSCYEGGDEPCGTCGTCRDVRKAFDDNGLTDVIQGDVK